MPSVRATMVGPRPAAPTIAVEDEVGAGRGDQLADALLAGEHLPAPASRGLLGGVRVGERDRRHAVLARLLDRRLPARAGGQADDLQLRRARAITSSACVPIDPVEPSIKTFFIVHQRIRRRRVRTCVLYAGITADSAQ